MYLNLILAFSNIFAFYPVYYSYIKNDIITMLIILAVSIASVISHLFENHKHGMPGMQFSKTIIHFLNVIDSHLKNIITMLLFHNVTFVSFLYVTCDKISHVQVYKIIWWLYYLFTAMMVFLSIIIAIFLSYFLDEHKYKISTIGIYKTYSYYLNRLDVFFAIVTVSRFMLLFFNKYNYDITLLSENINFFILVSISFAFLAISEYDKYNASLRQMYVITHFIWHVSIYMIMSYAIQYIL